MTLIKKIFTLQSISPFNKLKDSELILTANITKIKKYQKGATIYTKDVSVNSLFIILRGETITKSGKKFYNFFGLKEILNDLVFKEDIVANSEIKAMVITKAHFFTLIYECPDLTLELLNLLDKDRIES